MKLRRTVATYEACTPEGVSGGSEAQMRNFVADAQHDIAVLADARADLVAELEAQLAYIGEQIRWATGSELGPLFERRDQLTSVNEKFQVSA